MLRRRSAQAVPPPPPARPALPPLPALQVVLNDNRHAFGGSSGEEVDVDGFDIDRPDGSPVYLSEDGAIDDRVFYFRVAGVAHHKGGAQSPAFGPLAQVFLVREPENPADPNALRVIGQDQSCAGYVPRELAAIMTRLLARAGSRVATGVVTKTYSTTRGRNAIEVLAMCDRNLEVVAHLGDGDHYQPRVISTTDNLFKLPD